jgi:hypothetical protein
VVSCRMFLQSGRRPVHHSTVAYSRFANIKPGRAASYFNLTHGCQTPTQHKRTFTDDDGTDRNCGCRCMSSSLHVFISLCSASNQRRGRVINTPASYSEDPVLESRPRRPAMVS